MKNRRGEIATILTIGTLVIIGATAVISSLGLSKQKSTSTRAACASNTCAGSGTTCLPIGTVNSGLTCCAAHLGQVDHTWATWNTSCKAAVNTPVPTMTVAPTQTGCKTPPMICTDPVGTQGACCKGYICYGAGSGFASRCTAPASTTTPIPSVTTNPAASCSKGGQPIIGTGGYSHETCESICGAQNGTYVGPNQQWQEGTQRGCCCTTGNTSSICPQPGLGYACCVQDDRCGTGIRYRWYGCTGQVCSATKIKTQGGPGYLVDCPYGIDKNSNSETGVCSDAVIPPPSAECVDKGSYGLLGGCRDNCKTAGYECTASASDTSGEKRFCCPTTPTVDPNAPSERNAPCVTAYGATSYCSTNYGCSGDDEYAPDGGSVACQDTTTTTMNQRCCKPKGVVDPNAKCEKHGCKDLSKDFSAVKSYYQKGTEYYSSYPCSASSAKYASLDAVMVYCAEGLIGVFDKHCIEVLQDPNAQCVLNPLGWVAGGGYEKTTTKCGPLYTRFCYQKKAGENYISRKCSSINAEYDTTKSVYEKDGKYYHKDGTTYTEYSAEELLEHCSTSFKTPFDNKCIRELNDPTAQCVINIFGWVAGGGYEKTTTRCGLLDSRFCYVKIKTDEEVVKEKEKPLEEEIPEVTEEPVFTVPEDVVTECPPANIFPDTNGFVCLSESPDGSYTAVPYIPPNP